MEHSSCTGISAGKEENPVAIGNFTDDKTSDAQALILYTYYQSQNHVTTKTAKVYLMYDLDTGSKRRPFTGNDFILPLAMQDKSIALKYNNDYYVLTHPAELGAGFKNNRLRLQLVTGGTKMTPVSVENGVKFTVSGGDIYVTFDAENVTFSTVKEGTQIVEAAEETYKFELPPF
ncbi:MAG: hypothetical protein HYW03_18420, partial [Deltaproteobacteria bacterium]|nr:hypothetical protein [Deltaproteobacteria bacterium]